MGKHISVGINPGFRAVIRHACVRQRLAIRGINGAPDIFILIRVLLGIVRVRIQRVRFPDIQINQVADHKKKQEYKHIGDNAEFCISPLAVYRLRFLFKMNLPHLYRNLLILFGFLFSLSARRFDSHMLPPLYSQQHRPLPFPNMSSRSDLCILFSVLPAIGILSSQKPPFLFAGIRILFTLHIFLRGIRGCVKIRIRFLIAIRTIHTGVLIAI